ncbi:MAG: GTPase ObgE [Ruminococcaceae bacterium]|nr:GTPase ObgE [Oscillospiraceae bacterium]
MIIDKVKLYVKAGDGGNGCVSFRREKYVSHGGPDGGDGGNGGNIILEIDEGENTLLRYKYHKKFIANNGGDGMNSKFHGKTADDLILKVPLGTVVKDAESGRVIKDMSNKEPFMLCKGGRGGWGNRHFSTPTRQIPRFAKSGMKGEEKEVIFELKMLADVGLVGFPNVGKSMLLSKISAARPKIANYEFTTLSPNLGVVDAGEENSFVVADIPGIIEGASEGAGLGHEFLRHIDRCRLLIHVVDVSGLTGRNPIEDIEKINAELADYSEDLANRPQIIAANKSDMIEEGDFDKEAFEAYISKMGYELIYISALTNNNVKELVRRAASKLKELPPMKIFEADYVPEDNIVDDRGTRDILIKNVNGVYVVEAEWIYNLMGSINFEDYESLMYFQKVLKNAGVFEKLENYGVKDGDTVSLYDFEFDFVK